MPAERWWHRGVGVGGDEWQDVKLGYVRDGDAWKVIKRSWVRNGDQWVLVNGFIGQLTPNSSTNVSGNWSPSGAPTLHEAVDESTPDDAATYIYAPAIVSVCPTNEYRTVEFGFPQPSTPRSGGEVLRIKVRGRKVEFYQVNPPTMNVTIELREGTTVRGSTSGTFTAAWSTLTWLVPDSVKGAVQDWSQARVRIQCYGCVDLELDSMEPQITWVAMDYAMT